MSMRSIITCAFVLLLVATTPTYAQCTTDAECVDADPCTNDICSLGTCANIYNGGDPNPGCLVCDPVLCAANSNECSTYECFGALGCSLTSGTSCGPIFGAQCDAVCDFNTGCTNPSPVECNDNDACTEDFCDSGVCTNVPLQNTCPLICRSGTVVAGQELVDIGGQCFCQDSNSPGLDCTGDNFGCLSNICQVNAQSGDAECVADPVTTCDDGNPCTIDSCDENGFCVTANAPNDPNPACDDGLECTNDFCLNGACANFPINEGGACTVGPFDSCPLYICQLGICSLSGQEFDCDDGNPCTADECAGPGGVTSPPSATSPNPQICNHFPLICDNPGPCFTAECVPSAAATFPETCVVTPIDCDDGDLCTVDTCNGGVCEHTPIDCDDGDLCTVGSCNAGTGQCQYTPATCSSPDPCQVSNSCNPATGCVFTPLCDDGDACTTDSCSGGICTNTAINCDDGETCTSDSCVGGVCVNTFIDCNDNNPCTIDSCAVSGACLHEPKPCNLANPNLCAQYSCRPYNTNRLPCTIFDVTCVTGICERNSAIECDAIQTDLCAPNTCDPDTGVCSLIPVGPGYCATNYVCLSGACITTTTSPTVITTQSVYDSDTTTMTGPSLVVTEDEEPAILIEPNTDFFVSKPTGLTDLTIVNSTNLVIMTATVTDGNTEIFTLADLQPAQTNFLPTNDLLASSELLVSSEAPDASLDITVCAVDNTTSDGSCEPVVFPPVRTTYLTITSEPEDYYDAYYTSLNTLSSTLMKAFYLGPELNFKRNVGDTYYRVQRLEMRGQSVSGGPVLFSNITFISVPLVPLTRVPRCPLNAVPEPPLLDDCSETADYWAQNWEQCTVTNCLPLDVCDISPDAAYALPVSGSTVSFASLLQDYYTAVFNLNCGLSNATLAQFQAASAAALFLADHCDGVVDDAELPEWVNRAIALDDLYLDTRCLDFEPGTGCVRSWGYWKNYNKKNPATPCDQDDICGISAAELYRTPPKRGNVWIMLVHQYLGAMANDLCGTAGPNATDIQHLQNAYGFLVDHCDDRSVTARHPDRHEGIQLMHPVADFNEGYGSVPSCADDEYPHHDCPDGHVHYTTSNGDDSDDDDDKKDKKDKKDKRNLESKTALDPAVTDEVVTLEAVLATQDYEYHYVDKLYVDDERTGVPTDELEWWAPLVVGGACVVFVAGMVGLTVFTVRYVKHRQANHGFERLGTNGRADESLVHSTDDTMDVHDVELDSMGGGVGDLYSDGE